MTVVKQLKHILANRAKCWTSSCCWSWPKAESNVCRNDNFKKI